MLHHVQVLEELRRLLPSEWVEVWILHCDHHLTGSSLPTECETFSRSGDAVFELSTRFAEPFFNDTKLSSEEQLKAKKLMFLELTQVALWGNATDLSLLIDMSEDDIKKLQSTGGDHLASTEQNILDNKLPEVWEYISSPTFGGSKEKGGRIDIGERA